MGMCCANVTGMENLYMRFPLSGNKMSCFCIQNLVSRRKHLDSHKHMKKTDKHMKKSHIYIYRERNKSVAIVYVPLCVCVCVLTCFFFLFNSLVYDSGAD